MEPKTTPEYETPQVTDLGDLAELTAAGRQSGRTDANYNMNTPSGQNGGLFS